MTKPVQEELPFNDPVRRRLPQQYIHTGKIGVAKALAALNNKEKSK